MFKKLVSQWILVIILIVVAAYFLGPKTPKPKLDLSFPVNNTDLKNLGDQIKNQETSISNIKPGNQAEIVWFDSLRKSKTEYSIVYLHGFSASHFEGNPVHRKIAEKYGCNLFLSRLFSHGLMCEDPLIDVTADKLWVSAKEALEIGNKLGDKVIIVSTSTGGTLALYLASKFPDKVHSLVLYSPNIQPFDKRSAIALQPWGLQMGRLIFKSKFMSYPASDEMKKYWSNPYRLEAIGEMMALVKSTMKEDVFNSVKQTVFLAYYYKNEQEQDEVVSVDAMLEMFDQLGADPEQKMKRAFPKAGNHVIACGLLSKDWKSVYEETCLFLEEKVGLLISVE